MNSIKKNLAKLRDPILAATLTKIRSFWNGLVAILTKLRLLIITSPPSRITKKAGKLYEASDRFTQALQSQPTSIGAPLPPTQPPLFLPTALPTTTTPLPNVPQRPAGPAPQGMTWDYSTGQWKPCRFCTATKCHRTITTNAPVTIDRTPILKDSGQRCFATGCCNCCFCCC